MTSFRIERIDFDKRVISRWGRADERHRDWPVVYTLNNDAAVYVGESVNAAGRLRQHSDSGKKQGLVEARVVIDESFNKSACLDLESSLIKWFAGDGSRQVLNANAGVANGNYFDRDVYRGQFEEIFEQLRAEGLFTASIEDIENSDLYKLSPFTSLSEEQTTAVVGLMEHLLTDLRSGSGSSTVVEGEPGTGKTIVAIFLMKLLIDLQGWDGLETEGEETPLWGFFTAENQRTLQDLRVGLVVPQQSLRQSIRKVFDRTPGLSGDMVLTPFDVGESTEPFDLLVVDETHRLNQRANQTSAQKNTQFRDINIKLFGHDDPTKTQLDWITEMSHHQVLLLDVAQRVRPADLSVDYLRGLSDTAREDGHLHTLTSQFRVADQDYVRYIRRILSPSPPDQRMDFSQYDVRLFSDVSEMVSAIRARDAEVGLSRLVAGYAWEWVSRKNARRADIVFGDIELKWNSRIVDWVDSPNSANEVGSIHTIQGYDLNYAGVIIGPDLRYDEQSGQLRFDRDHYYDRKGVQNNPGQKLTQDDLLELVANIYAVLLTRGIRGSYIYACDPGLLRYLAQFIGSARHDSHPRA
jgi:uncharacterized protein